VVLLAQSGLTPGAALAFLAVEQLGHPKVSVLMDSVDEWGQRGSELTKVPTVVGAPQTPKDLWQLISKAGVPRHAEVILFADDPAEAAVNYYIFRLMGWPDVKVWAN
jgi:3-mercaptopyruvate sulfurtransferase SseA